VINAIYFRIFYNVYVKARLKYVQGLFRGKHILPSSHIYNLEKRGFFFLEREQLSKADYNLKLIYDSNEN